MKNVFIGGVTRAGKSTLTNMLYHKLGYSIFELDTIVHSFTKIFPQLGIDESHNENLEENFTPFAYEMLKCCDKDRKYGKVKVAINGFQLSPSTIANFPKVENMIVIFLGMSDVTSEQLYKNIKDTQEEGDWTIKLSDEKLLKTCEKFIEKSKNLKKECEKYNYMYFDTSINREKTFNDIVDMLKNINE